MSTDSQLRAERLELEVTQDTKWYARNKRADRVIENGHVVEVQFNQVGTLENTDQIAYR